MAKTPQAPAGMSFLFTGRKFLEATRTPSPATLRSIGLFATFLTSDSLAPSVPQNPLAVPISTARIDVSWNASTDTGGSGLAGYRIYRDGSATPLTTTTATSISDTGLDPSTSYSYRITAYDNAGNESALSSAASGTTQSLASGAPLILYTDITSGPVNSDSTKAAYLSIYGLNFGNFSDYGVTNFVTIGGVAIGDYRCLTAAVGLVGTFFGIQRLTVNVGALTGLTLGTAYAISVTVGGTGPSNSTSAGNYINLDGDALTFVPNPGRIIYVDPVNGVNPSVGTVPTGANSANGDGGFNHPVKDLQTYANSASAFGGALTCPNSQTTTPTATTTTPPGTHIILRGGTYTSYLTNTSFAQYRWACPWQVTGSDPTGATNTGPIVITAYPGAAGSNAPESPQFVAAASSSATANAGGIHGTDSARSQLANSFNGTGYGQQFHVSNLKIVPNPNSQSSDGGPINLQNNARKWRVVNNECVWQADASVPRQTAGIQVVGDLDRIHGNYIHDIYGDSAQENHGIYNGEGGGIGVTNVIESFNYIKNITNATGVSVANGGSGIQFHQGGQGKTYTNCKVHHNVIDTVVKYGINCVGGSRTIDAWCNLLIDVQQIPFNFADNSISLCRFENNTVIGCNFGNNFGYGGTGYTFIWNNGGATPANTIRFKNNLFYQRAGAPTYGGYVSDGSGSAISLDTNYFFDASGQRTSAVGTNGVYVNPQFADLAGGDYRPGASSTLPNKGITPPSIGFTQRDLQLLTMPQGSNTKVVVGALERAGG